MPTNRAVPHFSLFTHDQCEAVHHASLEILRRTGVRVHHPRAARCRSGTRMPSSATATWSASPRRWSSGRWPDRRRGSRFASAGAPKSRAGRGGTRSQFRYRFRLPELPGPAIRRAAPVQRSRRHRVRPPGRNVLPQLDFCMSMGMPSDLNPRAPYCDEFALDAEIETRPSRSSSPWAAGPSAKRSWAWRPRPRGAWRSCASARTCSGTANRPRR